jgi:hypothetical protein
VFDKLQRVAVLAGVVFLATGCPGEPGESSQQIGLIQSPDGPTVLIRGCASDEPRSMLIVRGDDPWKDAEWTVRLSGEPDEDVALWATGRNLEKGDPKTLRSLEPPFSLRVEGSDGVVYGMARFSAYVDAPQVAVPPVDGWPGDVEGRTADEFARHARAECAENDE